jgi:hypothetical protein
MEERDEERKEEKRNLLNPSIYLKTINDGKKGPYGDEEKNERYLDSDSFFF